MFGCKGSKWNVGIVGDWFCVGEGGRVFECVEQVLLCRVRVGGRRI